MSFNLYNMSVVSPNSLGQLVTQPTCHTVKSSNGPLVSQLVSCDELVM